jgi:hypothetical protein
MSKFVKVQTQLRELSLIKRALDDLRLEYQENAHFNHLWSGFRGQVPVVVKVRGATFGLRTTDQGDYEVIGDDMQMAAIRKELARIQQRYAYHAVVEATQAAGFDLVEETTGRDQVIRMTVRRWA